MTVVEDSTVVDDETITAARAAVRAAYDQAIVLVAPRVLARINALTAAAGSGHNDQIITDGEWADLAEQHVDDTIGDSILDGVVAGAAQFAKLANPTTFVRAFAKAAANFAGFASQLRSNLDTWITNTIGQGITGDWGIGKVLEALRSSSPLSPDKADMVAGVETQAGVNAGLWTEFAEANVAAVRWVTMRDERVRPAHAAADRDTIPLGERFSIDGHEARFPGDPDLPFPLRVNCRCTLAYVEGTQVRRVVGATKSELRARAAELEIPGRAKMNKGQLQHAVLAELCLQGLAGGPDCPDLLDQMNRTALLTVARGEGLTGRYRMSREQLIYQLRQSVLGGDIAQTVKGYATADEFAKSRKLATYKKGRVKPSGFGGTSPTPDARRASRQSVFEQFGGVKNGSVPCVHCGLRLAADPAAGLAVLVPEPIIPWSEGGTLALDNLVPSCPSCFRALGGRGLVSATDLVDELVEAMSQPITDAYVPDRLPSPVRAFIPGRTGFTHEGAIKAWQSRDRGPGLPDVPFADVQIAYKPRHPDGHADPGEVVWAEVPFEEDKTKSKDRPVLIIGRTKDGKNLVGLQMTSKPGPGRKNLGDGAWDQERRDSYLKFDRFIQIDANNYRKEGAYMKKPQFQEIIDELTHRQHAPDVDLSVEVFTHEGAVKAWQSRHRGMSAGEVADNIRADHPGVTIELVDKTHGDPHWELDRLIVPDKGEGVGSKIMADLTAAADANAMPITLTPEPIGSGSRTALERFYKRHGFVANTGRNKLTSSKEAMVRYPQVSDSAGAT